MAEAKETKPAEAFGREPKSLTLKKSGVAVIWDAGYVAGDSIAAQRAAGKATHRYPLYLMQRICRFNGTAWTAQQIEEQLPGADYLTLLGEILGGSDAEDEAGNA